MYGPASCMSQIGFGLCMYRLRQVVRLRHKIIDYVYLPWFEAHERNGPCLGQNQVSHDNYLIKTTITKIVNQYIQVTLVVL